MIFTMQYLHYHTLNNSFLNRVCISHLIRKAAASMKNVPMTAEHVAMTTTCVWLRTVIKDGDYQSLAERNDSIQIETFNQKKDTFHIKWKNNFEYILTKKNPKTDLDKKPFVVKITGVKQNSYTFSASFEGSSYKQNGEAEKLQ